MFDGAWEKFLLRALDSIPEGSMGIYVSLGFGC